DRPARAGRHRRAPLGPDASAVRHRLHGAARRVPRTPRPLAAPRVRGRLPGGALHRDGADGRPARGGRPDARAGGAVIRRGRGGASGVAAGLVLGLASACGPSTDNADTSPVATAPAAGAQEEPEDLPPQGEAGTLFAKALSLETSDPAVAT